MLLSITIVLTLGLACHCHEMEEVVLPATTNSSICYEKVRADVIFLLDISTSIGRVLWHKEAKFAAGLVQGFIVGPDDVLFGAVIFNRSPTKIFDLNSDRSISETLLAIPYPNIRGTNTHLGLSKIRSEDLFRAEAGGRHDVRDFLVVVTDGLSNSPNETVKEAQLLKDSGVTVIAVGVGAANAKELAALASGPEYIFTAKSFNQLDIVKINVVKVICQGDAPFAPTPPPETTNKTTTTTTTTPTTTTTTPTTTTTTAPTTTTTTLATTTTTPTTTTSKSTTTTTTPTTTTTTPTTTSKKSTTTTTTTPTTTTTTPTTTTTTPTTTTTTPTTTTTKTTTTTTTKPTTTTTTPKTTSKSTTTTTTSTTTTTTPTTTTTKSTTASITTKKTTTTTIPLAPPPLGELCQDDTKADIILLIHASRSISAQDWEVQMKFAAELVQTFTIGPADVLFGCLVFNSVPTKLFDLKTYTNQTTIAATLLGTSYPVNTGTYTHLGLSEIMNNHLFNTTAGGRDDAKDYLIVMTDELSFDANKSKSESLRLKVSGVTIIPVAIGLDSSAELVAMSSGPNYIFYIDDYSSLKNNKRALVKKICNGALIQ